MRIVSGGQTGVDRAALDAAIHLDVEHGGWCPLGRRSDDGMIPQLYQLQETESANYAVRTRKNVADSDGTLILHRGKLQGGTKLTAQIAESVGRPLLVVDLDDVLDVEQVVDWIHRHSITVLNVAGPRERGAPGIRDTAYLFVRQLLERLVEPS